MIYRTICAMDNITIEMDGDCREACFAICEIQNEWFERSKADLGKALTDLYCFGNAFMLINDTKATYVPFERVMA